MLNYVKLFYTGIMFAMRPKHFSCTYTHTHACTRAHTHSLGIRQFLISQE